MTILPALAFGFALGVRHATDADHIAAVGTIAGGARSARRAALLGAAWGAGHSMSVLLVGGSLVIFRLPMPVRVALALEFLVAIMLIGLGARALLARRRETARAGEGIVSSTRPLLIGVMHGLAGSAVLALLVLGTTSTASAAAIYLVCFCLGTIAAMALVTTALTLPTRLSSTRALSVERVVRVAASVASIGIGVAIAHRVGIRDGLFAATPNPPTWAP